MSAFGFYEKDNVVTAIIGLAEYEKSKGFLIRETIASILEATNYAVDTVLYNELEKA